MSKEQDEIDRLLRAEQYRVEGAEWRRAFERNPLEAVCLPIRVPRERTEDLYSSPDAEADENAAGGVAVYDICRWLQTQEAELTEDTPDKDATGWGTNFEINLLAYKIAADINGSAEDLYICPKEYDGDLTCAGETPPSLDAEV